MFVLTNFVTYVRVFVHLFSYSLQSDESDDEEAWKQVTSTREAAAAATSTAEQLQLSTLYVRNSIHRSAALALAALAPATQRMQLF